MIKFKATLLIIGLLLLTGISETLLAKPIVLVVGDSLSDPYGFPAEKGWVALLEYKLKATYPKAKVINASGVGDTTQNGVQKIEQNLKQHKLDLVIIELGGNDGLRGAPILYIRQNLNTMVQQAKAAGAKVLLLGMQLPPNYGPKYTQQFYEVYRSLAKKHKISLMPFFLEGVALTQGMMQADGIHPTVDAQPMLLEGVWPYIQELLN